jgi:adenylate cyclase
MVDGVIDAGLPPTHIGIHAGAVIFQDGDVYGRTVNMAARIAAQAEGGEVLASEHAASVATGGDVEFDPVRTVELKGIADPVTLYRARRAGAELSDDRP